MLGYLVNGFLRLLLRFWTFGLLYFLDNRLFVWIKNMAIPRLSYKKIHPCIEERRSREHYIRMDSEVCLLNSNQYSWNSLFLSSLSSSKKLPYLWLVKMMMLSKQSQKTFLPKSSKPCSSQEFWNLHSITEAAEMADEESKSNAILKDNCSLIPREIIPNCLDVKRQDMSLLEQGFFKDFYHELLQKEKEKMEFLKQPEDTTIVFNEKHCGSAASIDSGYRSFPSVKSSYTYIEEEGVTLYVSNCRYDNEGKLIGMTVGFSVAEDSTASSDSLIFDDELSDVSDSECKSSDESEEDFIVFDADSCNDGDSRSFDSFVFEGTADQISVAMSMNCQPTLKITISQTLPDHHFCFSNDTNSSEKVVQEVDHFQDNYNDNSTDTRTDNSSDSAGTVQKKKKVHFQTDKTEVHKIIAWDFAYRQARIGHWKNYVIDRLQFQRRIDQAAKVIEPVLEKKLTQMKN